MDSGADAEILSLLDLPSSAPDLWTMLSKPQGSQVQSDKLESGAQNITASTYMVAQIG